MMRHLIAALALFCVASVAQAADVSRAASAAIAAPAPGCTVDYCVGAVVGVDLSGVATNVNVFANGINGSLNAGGTLIGVHGGYRLWNGKIYVAGEVGCAGDVSGGTSGLGVSFSDRWSCTELLKFGGSLSSLFNTGPITFPAALQPYLMSLYFIAGGKQRMNSTGVVGGAGAEFVIGPRSTIFLEYLNTQYGSGASDTLGIAAKSENLFRIGYNYNFPINY